MSNMRNNSEEMLPMQTYSPWNISCVPAGNVYEEDFFMYYFELQMHAVSFILLFYFWIV